MRFTSHYEFATPVYAEAIALRQEVLRLPLGLDIADDPLAEEYLHVHVGVFDKGRLIGTCSLRENQPGHFQMRQVAVLPQAQGLGVGRALVCACERHVETIDTAKRLFCHAREVAKPFYESVGWTVAGAVFTEVGIPHFPMDSLVLVQAQP